MKPPSRSGAERLATDVAGPSDGRTRDVLAGWLAASPAFRIWVAANTPKVRKKLRAAAGDADALRDVLTELDVARRLLSGGGVVLEYEAYGSGRLGPDFTLTARDGRRLNVEVTRARGHAFDQRGSPWLAKLRQLPPSVANVLVVALDADAMPEAGEGVAQIGASVESVRRRIAARDGTAAPDPGLPTAGRFREGIGRLAAIVGWSDVPGMAPPVWVNPDARIPVPGRALRSLAGLLTADDRPRDGAPGGSGQ